MGGRAFDNEAVLFIATAQWACNGSVPPRLAPPLDPCKGFQQERLLPMTNSNGHPHGQPKPSNIVYNVCNGNSDNAGHERLQRFVAHLVGEATGIS